jgi:hypothetical protein
MSALPHSWQKAAARNADQGNGRREPELWLSRGLYYGLSILQTVCGESLPPAMRGKMHAFAKDSLGKSRDQIGASNPQTIARLLFAIFSTALPALFKLYDAPANENDLAKLLR